jgi:hypothetical protein
VTLVRVVAPLNVRLPSARSVTRPTLLPDKVLVRKKNVTVPLNVPLRVANDKLVTVTWSTSAPLPPGVSEATPARTVVAPTGGGPPGFDTGVEQSQITGSPTCRPKTEKTENYKHSGDEDEFRVGSFSFDE